MSACSAKEQEVWKDHLLERISAENCDLVEGRLTHQDIFSSLSLDIRSIDTLLGLPHGFVRRMSVQRAATLGPKATLHQVVIKNTEAQRLPDISQSSTSLPMARSQSHLSTNHITTLAPRRGERIRLETTLSDVWTKDVLPYPGMCPRRAENPIRASANSVMRKLSMASIASNFSSRRTMSFSSMSRLHMDDDAMTPYGCSRPASRKSSAPREIRPGPPLVDFHNAPDAFLPTDFELQGMPSSRRRRFVNRSMHNNERAAERSHRRSRRLSSAPSPHNPPHETFASFNIRKVSNKAATPLNNGTVPIDDGIVEALPKPRKLKKPEQPPPSSPSQPSQGSLSMTAKRGFKSKTRFLKLLDRGLSLGR